ncbi:DUF3450 family protein [Planctobacterium marinum]|uniref:DUF3450 family protein n=1 Tax=Planctobacterium marinum TaxID=1631968 RepID=UPI001E57E357|nr:DUF3450 family protein [Planctobacterium marinum]MCC2603958.1 DUF3450 domain-containing protein [Planctobacterium marinum]
MNNTVLNKKPSILASCRWILLLAMTPMSVTFADSKAQSIDNLLLQWQQIEAQRTQIKGNWQLRQQLLEQQLQLLADERATLTELLEQKHLASSEAATERKSLLLQQSELEAQQASLLSELNRATGQILAINGQLPPVLQNSWQTHVEKLNEADLPASEMLNHIAEALKKLHSFNSRIVLHQTVMQLPTNDGEKSIQVQQVFLGAATGWYISNDQQYWGKGQTTPSGWHWEALQNTDSVLADTLSALVDSLEQPSRAEWISLPFDISSVPGGRQ